MPPNLPGSNDEPSPTGETEGQDPHGTSAATLRGEKERPPGSEPAKGHHFLSWKSWIFEHKGEIFWALVFAVFFAWPAARFIDPPEHHPYEIRVIEYSHTDDDTQKMFANLAFEWSKQSPKIGDVPVKLEVIRLPDDSPETIKGKAEELVLDEHTLMVIGHLPSGLTEVSLPIYFGARPQVPYISTTASDDDLLVRCQGKCAGDDGFVPLVQPSPRNSDQADSAVRFAVQNKKWRFLIVTEDDRDNDSYSQGMIQGFRRAIDKIPGAIVVGTHSIGSPPSDEQIREWNADCILYAGRAGAAETLLHSLNRQELMVILSDSVVETRGSNARLAALTSVRFTYPTDATDYNRHVSVYGKDAVSISKQLMGDLNKRGGDVWFKLRSFIHIETIQGARRNLVRVMKENAETRTWYACESSTACVFDQHRRVNGMFHVWQVNERGEAHEMLDVDGWHPPRTTQEK